MSKRNKHRSERNKCRKKLEREQREQRELEVLYNEAMTQEDTVAGQGKIPIELILDRQVPKPVPAPTYFKRIMNFFK
jgi:hypothetical protein